MKCFSLPPTSCTKWTSYLTFLYLSFLICKLGILFVYLLHRFMRIEVVKCLEHYLPHSKCLNVSYCYYYYLSSYYFILGGSKIATDGDCSHKIKRCLLFGRIAMTNLERLLKSRDITLTTKVYLVKAMVFPVVMYGCESWTIKKA